jgi:hypothetical protein
MEHQHPRPAVERPYEDPPKPEQRAANWEITAIMALVAAIFLAAIILYVVLG